MRKENYVVTFSVILVLLMGVDPIISPPAGEYIRVDRGSYCIGDPIRITFYMPGNGCAVIWDHMTNGQTKKIFDQCQECGESYYTTITGRIEGPPGTETLEMEFTQSACGEISGGLFVDSVSFSVKDCDGEEESCEEWLHVKCNVGGYKLYIDGDYVLTEEGDGECGVKLSPGTYDVKLKKEGCGTVSETVRIECGYSTTLRVTMDCEEDCDNGRDDDGDGKVDCDDSDCRNDPDCDPCKKDSDNDGINDCDDDCPYEKENYNDYKDDDGCPDTPPPTTTPSPATTPPSPSLEDAREKLYENYTRALDPWFWDNEGNQMLLMFGEDFFDSFTTPFGILKSVAKQVALGKYSNAELITKEVVSLSGYLSCKDMSWTLSQTYFKAKLPYGFQDRMMIVSDLIKKGKIDDAKEEIKVLCSYLQEAYQNVRKVTDGVPGVNHENTVETAETIIRAAIGFLEAECEENCGSACQCHVPEPRSKPKPEPEPGPCFGTDLICFMILFGALSKYFFD